MQIEQSNKSRNEGFCFASGITEKLDIAVQILNALINGLITHALSLLPMSQQPHGEAIVAVVVARV